MLWARTASAVEEGGDSTVSGRPSWRLTPVLGLAALIKAAGLSIHIHFGKIETETLQKAVVPLR